MPMWSPGADAERREPVRDLVGPPVEFAVRQMVVADDEREAIGHTVGDVLEEVGDVVGHRVENRTRSSFGARPVTGRLGR